MTEEKFNYKDIAPYEGDSFEEAMQRLREYPQLINNFTDIISRSNRFVNKWKSFKAKRQLRVLMKRVHSCQDFQKLITCNLFLKMVESSSINEFTYSGIEKEDNKAHVYISNHRDIVLDAALLGLALNTENKNICQMVIGNNLLSNQFVTDIFKVNGSITVRRDLSSASELKAETLRLSSYIRDCIVNKNQSVWIAQKSGRSKDGIDNTSPAILKMLYLSFREEGISFEQFLDTISIVPVSMSYQYDPCDVTKSHEEIRKLKAEGCYDVYKKKKYEDIIDVVRGIRHYKGNVNITVGTEVKGLADVRAAVREIDRQIHVNYKLWNTNYFAYDFVNETERFKEKYQDLDTKGFVKHYQGLNQDVINFVYREYANPVQSMLNETEN